MSHKELSKRQHDDMKRRHQNYTLGGMVGGWGAYPGFYTYGLNTSNYGSSEEQTETAQQEAAEDAVNGNGSFAAGMGDVTTAGTTSGDSVGTGAEVGTAQSA
jgi:hypothetical protein